MTPAEVLEALRADGVLVELDGAGIALDGPDGAIDRWVPIIREHKAVLIEALTGAIEAARPLPQPEAENPPGADPACLVSLDGTDAETEILALFDGADDRRFCTGCQNLLDGVCRIAVPGGLVSARRGYRPVALPIRCTGFAPMGDDADQRSDAERWPGLIQNGGE